MRGNLRQSCAERFFALILVASITNLGVWNDLFAAQGEGSERRVADPLIAAESPMIPYRLKGRALISAATRDVHSGQPIFLEARFGCDGGFSHVYDPFFCTADVKKRVSLRVFDANGAYVGNALTMVDYDERGHGRWLYIQAGTIAGRVVKIATSDRTIFARDGTMIEVLGIGKYSLQFVMMGRYIDFRDASNDKPELRPGVREAEEICHSNVLQIEVQPRTSVRVEKENGERLKAIQSLRASEALANIVEDRQRCPFTATLAIENSNVEFGGQVDFSVIMVNHTNTSAALMNPRYSFPLPVETTKLLIFERNGKAIGDLLGHRKITGGGSLTAPTNWIVVPPGGIIGIRDRVRASVPSFADDVPPGSYRIQMLFLDRFVSDYPYAGLPEVDKVPDRENDVRYIDRMQKWRLDHPGTELFRSNAVEIKVGIGE